MADPVGDLFAKETPQKKSGWFLPFVLGVVVGFGGCWAKDQSWFDKKDQHQEEKELSLDGGYVVLVREAREVTLEQELVERSMSEYVATKGLSGFRILDDDQEEAKPFIEHAKEHGVELPMIAFVDKDKYIRKVAVFPADYTALEAFLP